MTRILARELEATEARIKAGLQCPECLGGIVQGGCQECGTKLNRETPVNITSKEIATRALLAVVVVLAGTVLGAALGTAIGSLIGFGPQGFLSGAFAGSILGVSFVLTVIREDAR
jgi:hypothetical protein